LIKVFVGHPSRRTADHNECQLHLFRRVSGFHTGNGGGYRRTMRPMLLQAAIKVHLRLGLIINASEYRFSNSAPASDSSFFGVATNNIHWNAFSGRHYPGIMILLLFFRLLLRLFQDKEIPTFPKSDWSERWSALRKSAGHGVPVIIV
jgi:TRAP-type C4-dicarboxylate transport system permease large subunit